MRKQIILLALSIAGAIGVQAQDVVPSSIPGCVLWLDAADFVDEPGTPVAVWVDKSAQGKSVAQNVLEKQPTISTNRLNGLPVVRFDKSKSQWLSGPAVLPAGVNNFSFFVIWRSPSRDQGGGSIVDQGGPENGSRAALYRNNSNYGFTGHGTGNDAVLWPYAAGEWKNTALEYDRLISPNFAGEPTNNIVCHDESGVKFATVNPALNTGASGLGIGCRGYTNGDVFNGEIAEVIVFDRVLDATTRNNLQIYLQNKWGVGTVYRSADTVIDFEHMNVLPTGWSGTGTAFASNQPVAEVTSRAQGSRTLISGAGPGRGNTATGTAIGPEFVLTNNTIRFLIGGGHQPTANFRLERKTEAGTWQTVRFAVGAQSAVTEVRWNVASLLGQTVRFVCEDTGTGSWQWTMVDYIRLGNEPFVTNSFRVDFSNGQIPGFLYPHRPAAGNTRVLGVVNGKLRADLYNWNGTSGTGASYDMWSDSDKAPKLLLPLPPDSSDFKIETFISAASVTNNTTSTEALLAGLMFVCERPGQGLYFNLAFGINSNDPTTAGAVRYEDPTNLKVNGSVPLFAIEGGRRVLERGVYLRAIRRGGFLYFYSSFDALEWTLLTTKDLTGLTLMYAGVGAKSWTAGPSWSLVDFDYLSYDPVVPPSNPAGVPGCVLWLDAAASQTVEADVGSGRVSRWRDKSGMGHDVVQTDVEQQPVTGVSQLNGYPVLTFGGTNYLQGPAVLPGGTPALTYFAVWKRTATPDSVIIEQSNVEGRQNRAAFKVRGTGLPMFAGHYNDAYINRYSDVGQWSVSALEFNKEDRTGLGVYMDTESGEYQTYSTGFVKESTVVGTSMLRIGSKVINGPGEYLYGEVAELLAWPRALTAVERRAVLFYLQEKWNVGGRYQAVSESDLKNARLGVSGSETVNLRGKMETYRSAWVAGKVTDGVLCADSVSVEGGSVLDDVFCASFTSSGSGSVEAGHVRSDAFLLNGALLRLKAPRSYAGMALRYPFTLRDVWLGDGNGPNLEIEAGAPQFVRTGPFGGSVYFDGSSSLRARDGVFPAELPVGTNAFTVCFNVMSDTGCGTSSGVYGYGTKSLAGGQNSARFANAAFDHIRNDWWANDVWAYLPAGQTFLGDWHAVAFVWDGVQRRTYLDGVLYQSNTPSTPNNVVADEFAIGRGVNALPMKGWLSDFAVFSRALDVSEVQNVFLFGSVSQSYMQDLVLASDAQLDLGGGTYIVQIFSGGGRVVNGTLVVTDRIVPEGAFVENLALADGVTIDKGGRSPIQVSGTLTVLGGGTTDLTGVEKDSFSWFTYGTLVGDFSQWTFTDVMPSRDVKLVVGNGSVRLTVQPKGTLLLFY